MQDWPFHLTVADICYKNVKMPGRFPQRSVGRRLIGRLVLVIAFSQTTLYLSVPPLLP